MRVFRTFFLTRELFLENYENDLYKNSTINKRLLINRNSMGNFCVIKHDIDVLNNVCVAKEK